MGRRGTVVGLAAAGLLAAAAAALAAPSPQALKIIAREFAFEPRDITARAGEVVFTVKNEGAIEHNFLIDDAAGRTVVKVAVIAPGKAEQVPATLRAGSYAIYCDLPGHKEAGMTGSLRVRD